ncbi:hypothetical protein FIBSPDRAFT_283363 [Athelia psychrophila]|uniref:Uncharacterized protein n=1 Tax=Athelia psychrophila TaxID=1759441 RepID=A0A166R483_9AGAM|nr:hypothetical protein FIBSPDRAFT_283363 [Fibularhizoctonia sp. CBS 109695]
MDGCLPYRCSFSLCAAGTVLHYKEENGGIVKKAGEENPRLPGIHRSQCTQKAGGEATSVGEGRCCGRGRDVHFEA